MVEIKKQHVEWVSIIVAVIFVGSVVALALTQSGGIASAASSSNVGVIDGAQVMQQHPKASEVQQALQQAVTDAEKDFQEKSAGMSDKEKAEYYTQTGQRLQQKQNELMEPLTQSIKDAVKAVADTKGITVVIDKNAVVYGGQDITQDVIKKLSK